MRGKGEKEILAAGAGITYKRNRNMYDAYMRGGERMKKRKIDVFDLLPPEAGERIDELGYKFLSNQGYDTEGAVASKEKRNEIKKIMKERGEELRYFGMVDKTTKAILVWFELYRGKERIGVSSGIKFLPRTEEGGKNGEG